MGNYNNHRNRAPTTTASDGTTPTILTSENPITANSTTPTEDSTSSPGSLPRRPRRLIFIYDFELPGRGRSSQTNSTDTIEETATTETTNAPVEDDIYLGNLFNEDNSLDETNTIQDEEDEAVLLSSNNTDAINAIAEEINSELGSINVEVNAQVSTDDLPPLEPTSEPSSPPTLNPTPVSDSSSSSSSSSSSISLPSRSTHPRMRVWIEVSPSSLSLSNLLNPSSENSSASPASSPQSSTRQITGHVIFVQVLPAGYSDQEDSDDLSDILNHTFQLASASRSGNPPASQSAIDHLETIPSDCLCLYTDSQPQCTVCFCEFASTSDSASCDHHQQQQQQEDETEKVVKIE